MRFSTYLSKICFTFSLFVIISCGAKKGVVDATEEIQEVVFDTLEVKPEDVGMPLLEEEELLPFNTSATRAYDLIHTKLELSFDWELEEVNGRAHLTIAPIFKPVDIVELDAKGMIIHDIFCKESKLTYKYDGMKLRVKLVTPVKRGDQYVINISYTARPSSSEGYANGAITSDKGLFFIDPRDTDPKKPSQIWTQGETENNSRWFPTFDKPNERCTQEVYVTVDNKYTTLSNGKLISSDMNKDGSRTDYWRQDKPHAPYLFMLAIGEYATVTGQWEDIPLTYLVEPDYKESAKAIFDHTPEMLTYFSDILDYKYPWDKYAQVVARDYVSGAMENTSASIFGEFVQKHSRELIDNDNDYIVAHELFHHWFGDLVTCESWANLTLNEGFANYSEYLWAEHHDGRMKADNHRLNELGGYLQSGNFHPLIHYRYADKEDMFDAHSYNKGGLVLHMLRNYLGDEVFFASLNKYLVDNAYTAVEVDELRMAFEDVSGEDLMWFFDQWYHRKGHPTIAVEYEYDMSSQELKVIADQIDSDFKMPIDIAVYTDKGQTLHRRWINGGVDTLIISDVVNPKTYVFDGTNSQLAIITEDKSNEQLYNQFVMSDLFLDKYNAINGMSSESPLVNQLYLEALEEDYYFFREIALQHFLATGQVNFVKEDQLKELMLNDRHSAVRAAALQLYAASGAEDTEGVIQKSLNTEQAYPVINTALEVLNEINPGKALEEAIKLKNEKTTLLNMSIGALLADSEKDEHRAWYEKAMKQGPIYTSLPAYINYAAYLAKHDPNEVIPLANTMKEGALNEEQGIYLRYFNTVGLYQIKEMLNSKGQSTLAEQIGEYVKEIKEKNQDPVLSGYYMQIPE